MAGLFVTALVLSGGCSVFTTAGQESNDSVVEVSTIDYENSNALRQRATEFGYLLMNLPSMTKKEGYYELQGFFEPSPTLVDHVTKFYREFVVKSQQFKIKSQSVTTIVIDGSETSAQVTFEMIARGPGGQKVPAEQETEWLQVEGKWYRATSEAQKRLN